MISLGYEDRAGIGVDKLEKEKLSALRIEFEKRQDRVREESKSAIDKEADRRRGAEMLALTEEEEQEIRAPFIKKSKENEDWFNAAKISARQEAEAERGYRIPSLTVSGTKADGTPTDELKFKTFEDYEKFQKGEILKVSNAKSELERTLRDQMVAMEEGDPERWKSKSWLTKGGEEARIAAMKETPEIEELVGAIKDLGDQVAKLYEGLERNVPRDEGFGKEFMTNMDRGLGVGFERVKTESEEIYTRLGEQLPAAMRDGLTNAMMAAVEGADELGDRLKEIGTSFLKMIQRAFLESAASRVVGVVGGAMGMNTGGKVVGGSGVRDDVPAVLTGGEYVINRRSAEMYGYDFLERLNRGEIPGFAKGGAVSMRVRGPKADERESYDDESRYGNIKRYRVTKKGRGIDPRLSGYALDNDPVIKRYFSDQREQFSQDLSVKRQEKSRREAKADAKKARKNMLLQIAASAGIAWTVNKGAEWLGERKWYQNWKHGKFEKRASRALGKSGSGYIDITGKSQVRRNLNPTQMQQEKAAFAALARNNPQNAAQKMYEKGISGTVNRDGAVILRNKGGSIPANANALLTGGEFVMGASAVNKYGTGFMHKMNSGGLVAQAQAGPAGPAPGGSTNNDIQITVNVDQSGQVQEVQTGSSSAEGEKAMAKKIKTAVLDVINEQQRIGGSLRR